jgi:hypothetical protein
MSLRYGLLRAVKDADFADDGTTSTEVVTNGLTLAALVFPVGWVTASVTFTASVDGTNFFAVNDAANSLVTVTSAEASQYIGLVPDVYRGISRFKLVSASGQSGGPLSVQCVLID